MRSSCESAPDLASFLVLAAFFILQVSAKQPFFKSSFFTVYDVSLAQLLPEEAVSAQQQQQQQNGKNVSALFAAVNCTRNVQKV